MLTLDDTIAALATPAGTAALALLRVSGPNTASLVEALLGRRPPPRRALRADYRDQAGQLVDEVLCTFFPGPRSYSGEDSLEITTHGSPFIVQRILQDLMARGCRPAAPGEFTQRAFLNGRMDLSQAEAVADLIQAQSDRALAAANQQLRGALRRHVDGIVQQLVQALARIEAYVDFPDEDLPPEDRSTVIEQVTAARSETGRLLATRRYGELLREGIKVVIAGAPNVGKSSLLNRLLGQERALVSPLPGTTRDFIEERVMLGAHCLRLIDTAGLSVSPEPIEAMGMEKSYEKLAEADLVLAVVDASAPHPALPVSLAEKLDWNRTLVVLNKIDLVAHDIPRWPDKQHVTTISCSAHTGRGIEALGDAIAAWADQWRADVGDDLIAVNIRHAHALSAAGEAMESALGKLRSSAPVELLASDLRAALAALGEIAGRVDNERVLDALFATFCIGK